MLCDIMLNVIMLNVIILSVVVDFEMRYIFKFSLS
jgi:hypothetical protein